MILELFNNLNEENKDKFCKEFAEIMDNDTDAVHQFIVNNKVPEKLKDLVLQYLQVATLEQNIFSVYDPELLCEMNRKYRDIVSRN